MPSARESPPRLSSTIHGWDGFISIPIKGDSMRKKAKSDSPDT